MARPVLIPAPPFSEIWCGISTTGSSSSPKLRRLTKTYAMNIATAPCAKSTTPALRYLRTSPWPRMA